MEHQLLKMLCKKENPFHRYIVIPKLIELYTLNITDFYMLVISQ